MSELYPFVNFDFLKGNCSSLRSLLMQFDPFTPVYRNAICLHEKTLSALEEFHFDIDPFSFLFAPCPPPPPPADRYIRNTFSVTIRLGWDPARPNYWPSWFFYSRERSDVVYMCHYLNQRPLVKRLLSLMGGVFYCDVDLWVRFVFPFNGDLFCGRNIFVILHMLPNGWGFLDPYSFYFSIYYSSEGGNGNFSKRRQLILCPPFASDGALIIEESTGEFPTGESS